MVYPPKLVEIRTVPVDGATNLNQTSLLRADPQHEGVAGASWVAPTLVYEGELQVPSVDTVIVVAFAQLLFAGCP